MALAVGTASGVTTSDSPIRPGDRIAIVGNTFADQLRVHGYLETLLLQRSIQGMRGKAVSIRNLGWGGDMLTARDRPTHFPSEESTLRAHQTDVLIACFGMGESFAGPEGLADFCQDLEAFIASQRGKTYNGHSAVRLILVSPIAGEDLGNLTPGWKRRNRELAAYTEVMGEVAAEHQIPFVNLYDAALCLLDDDTAPRFTRNGINPNSYGYWAMSRALADGLVPGEAPWRLRIDARAKTADGWGVKISSVEGDAGGLRFTVQEKNWPSLAPPTKGRVHDYLAGNRDTMVVEGLSPGDYLLTVDGEPVVAATHRKWAQGVAIDASPAHRSAEAYRQAVNDKNLQFTYSWKALNQVHIVGERKKSRSGQALPSEVIAFNRLAQRKDEALRAGIRLETREWRLIRNPDPFTEYRD
ncbi:MAG: SGNH/GDSL hydrolase family protein [Planctomycetes bacterium]|nr:SGNH/GDSL hydrolase family protein [Planctomycetota bacterium]